MSDDNSKFIPPKRTKPIGSGRKRIHRDSTDDNLNIPYDKDNPLQNSDGKIKNIYEISILINEKNITIPDKYRYLSPKIFGHITDESLVTIYTRVAEGRIDYTIFDGNFKTIDINSQKAKDYIKHRSDYLESVKRKEEEKNNNQKIKIKPLLNNFGEDLNELDPNLAIRALTAKVEKDEIDIKLKQIKAQKELNQLIDKKLVQDVFGRMGKCIREMVFPIPDRLSNEIAALFESTDPEKIQAVRSILNEDLSRFLSDFMTIMSTDLKNDNSDLSGDDDSNE